MPDFTDTLFGLVLDGTIKAGKELQEIYAFFTRFKYG
jgi:hypothetical protein